MGSATSYEPPTSRSECEVQSDTFTPPTISRVPAARHARASSKVAPSQSRSISHHSSRRLRYTCCRDHHTELPRSLNEYESPSTVKVPRDVLGCETRPRCVDHHETIPLSPPPRLHPPALKEAKLVSPSPPPSEQPSMPTRAASSPDPLRRSPRSFHGP